MREILFRGKVADEFDEWVQGYLLPNNVIWQMNPHAKSKCCGVGQFTVIPETVGQYTGLNDKNGKMIFEGDILCYLGEDNNVESMTVVFKDYGFLVDYGCGIFDDNLSFCSRCVVTSNIHDIPKLSEGDE